MEELVKSLQKQVEDANAANAQLDEQLTAVTKEKQALSDENAGLKKQAASDKEALEKLEIENAELKARLSTCKCGTNAAAKTEHIVAIDGTDYKYIGPAGFVFEGVRYSAEEAITNQELLKKLLALPGEAFLREQV